MCRRGLRYGTYFALSIFFTTLATLAKPDAGVLDLPFDNLVVFLKGGEDRTVLGGKLDGATVSFRQSGRPDLILPWDTIKAVLPVFPRDGSGTIEEIQKAIAILKDSREGLPGRGELSEESIRKWEGLIADILKCREKEKKQALAEQEADIQRAALEQANAEKEAAEQERKTKIEAAKVKIEKYDQLPQRKDVEEAMELCAGLSKLDIESIPSFSKANEYWKRCLALPIDVSLPRDLDKDRAVEISFPIEASLIGPMITGLLWVLLLLPLLLVLQSLSKVTSLLQERALLGAGIWMLVGLVAGGIFYFLFFTNHDEGRGISQIEQTATRLAWQGIGNVKDKGVTRFTEVVEVPTNEFLAELVAAIKSPEGNSGWVPILTESKEPGIQLIIPARIKWLSLPLRISFAIPAPKQAITFVVTGAHVGSFPVGAGVGAWLWEEIAPAYQAVGVGLGLEQGVKLLLLSSDKLMISLPEVQSKEKKPNP
jgi:hypothetical protein